MSGYRAALAIMGLWLAACSSVEQEDFDAELAEALCERYVRCGVSHDEDSCKRAQVEGFIGQSGLNTQFSAALSAGRMRYDADAARACLEKIRTGACDVDPLSTWMLVEGVGMSVDCRFLFGPVEDGEPCRGSGECGDRSVCTASGLYSCGLCLPRRGEGMPGPSSLLCEEGLASIESTCRQPLGEGQTCEDLGVFYLQPCAPGLLCDPDTHVCRRPASVGQTCGSQNPCHWSLRCTDGTCQALKAKGDACTLGECKRGLFCDAGPSAPGQCREQLGEGASCRGSQECERSFYCDGADPSTAERGTCRRLARQGEDCTGRPCGIRFYCSEASRTCQPRRQFGESCADEPWGCVVGASCNQGTCRGLVPSCP